MQVRHLRQRLQPGSILHGARADVFPPHHFCGGPLPLRQPPALLARIQRGLLLAAASCQYASSGAILGGNEGAKANPGVDEPRELHGHAGGRCKVDVTNLRTKAEKSSKARNALYVAPTALRDTWPRVSLGLREAKLRRAISWMINGLLEPLLSPMCTLSGSWLVAMLCCYLTGSLGY